MLTETILQWDMLEWKKRDEVFPDGRVPYKKATPAI